MSTPDTIGPPHRVATPARHQEFMFLQAATSTVGYSFGSATIANNSDDEDTDNEVDRPTFEACSRAIISAAERMLALTRQPRTLSVAIAYDECLDIITAAVNHLEEIESYGTMQDTVTETYRAMCSIRELLRPSPHVRRALRF